MAGRSNGSFMFFVLFLFVCLFFELWKKCNRKRCVLWWFYFYFSVYMACSPLPVWAILKLIPSTSLCSTGIPFPIPATGLAATQSGIIESAPWSCICIEIEWHARGCSAGHPYHLFLIRMKSFADADCFLFFFSPVYTWLVCVCVRVCTHRCLLLACYPLSVLVSALRWFHFKLDDSSQHDKPCKWPNDGISICWKLNCF